MRAGRLILGIALILGARGRLEAGMFDEWNRCRDLVLAQDPYVLAARLEAEEAEIDCRAKRLDLGPSLEADASADRDNGALSGQSSQGAFVGVKQGLFDYGQWGLSRRAQLDSRLKKARLRRVESDRVLLALDSYLDLALEMELVAARGGRLERLEAVVGKVQGLVESKSLPELDLADVQSAYLELQADLSAHQIKAQGTRGRLALQLGGTPNVNALEFSMGVPRIQRPLEELVESCGAANPDLAVDRVARELERQNMLLSEAGRFPGLSLEGGYNVTRGYDSRFGATFSQWSPFYSLSATFSFSGRLGISALRSAAVEGEKDALMDRAQREEEGQKARDLYLTADLLFRRISVRKMRFEALRRESLAAEVRYFLGLLSAALFTATMRMEFQAEDDWRASVADYLREIVELCRVSGTDWNHGYPLQGGG